MRAYEGVYLPPSKRSPVPLTPLNHSIECSTVLLPVGRFGTRVESDVCADTGAERQAWTK